MNAQRLIAGTTAIALLIAYASPADARRGGGGMRGGGMRSMSRPASPSRPSGGYNLGGDVMNRPSQLPSGAAGVGSGLPEGGANRPEGGLGANRPEGGLGANRPEGGPGADRPDGGLGDRPPGSANRPTVPPVNPPQPNWGWNGYVAWYPAPYYWGGGFWGPWGYGFTTAVVYGEIVDEETHETEKSYQVEPQSPGAKLLENYQLTQTQCGPEGLVVVHGPEKSVICATPNERVTAGHYDLDVTSLTITSRSPA
jgi:hypothetical protein